MEKDCYRSATLQHLGIYNSAASYSENENSRKKNNRIGLIRNDGAKRITIASNTFITVNRFVGKVMSYENTPALVQSTILARGPGWLNELGSWIT